MLARRLRLLRVVVATGMLVALTACLVDFRGLIPLPVGRWLASIQFVPSGVALVTGATLSVACLVIIVATLAVGRIYCSAICPLGILQDLMARLDRMVRRRRLLPYARPITWLRHLIFWGTVAGVAAGWGAFALSLVDPYSNYGRVAVDLFRPLAIFGNNLAAGPANAVGVGALYRVPLHWAGAGALHQPLVLLVLLTVLAVLRGRLYCNTLCPVGTLLGWLAHRAAFQLRINPGACTKCGDCLRTCKAQCIDLRTRAIDSSRCVACYNCLADCPEEGISYRLAWTRPAAPRPAPPAPTAALRAPDSGRRAFLAESALAAVAVLGAKYEMPAPASNGGPPAPGGAAETSRAISPPGARSIDRFLTRCTACHLCFSVCPTQVLEPAFLEYGWKGLMKPRLDYSKGACTFTCRACTEVCPDGAIDRLELADKQQTRIGEARLDLDRCIVKTKGTDCAACSEQCPTQAVTTVPYGSNLRLPQLNQDLCTGCGGCEFACPVQPVKAITVVGLRRHARARKAVEKKAVAPVSTDGFPF